MTVYVDLLPAGWGKWSAGAHMLGSDLEMEPSVKGGSAPGYLTAIGEWYA